MAPIALINAKIHAGGHDFTAETNKVMLSGDFNELNATTFGSQGWRERKAGLRDVKASMEGFWASAASDAVDPEAFNNLGVMDRVLTVSPAGVEAQPAYLTRFGQFAYNINGTVGELLPFTLGMSGSNKEGLVRGQLAAGKGAVSATGALGSPVQVGPVGASQFLYASFHVLGTPGTTITVTVQSDNAVGFPSATDVATIGPLTAAGGTWMTRVAGALTDDWFRFNVSAITGTFTVAGAIAVGS